MGYKPKIDARLQEESFILALEICSLYLQHNDQAFARKLEEIGADRVTLIRHHIAEMIRELEEEAAS